MKYIYEPVFLTPYAKEFSAGAASRTGEWVLSGPPRAVSATFTITLRWPVRAAFGNCRVAIRQLRYAPHPMMRCETRYIVHVVPRARMNIRFT